MSFCYFFSWGASFDIKRKPAKNKVIGFFGGLRWSLSFWQSKSVPRFHVLHTCLENLLRRYAVVCLLSYFPSIWISVLQQRVVFSCQKATFYFILVNGFACPNVIHFLVIAFLCQQCHQSFKVLQSYDIKAAVICLSFISIQQLNERNLSTISNITTNRLDHFLMFLQFPRYRKLENLSWFVCYTNNPQIESRKQINLFLTFISNFNNIWYLVNFFLKQEFHLSNVFRFSTK